MTNKFYRAVLILLAAALTSHAANEKPDPSQLVRSANESSDLSSVLPHRLTGTVVLYPGSKNESRGTFVAYRDHDQYRSDIDISSQHRTWLHLGNKIYISDYSPVAFLGLEKLKDIENAWRESRADDHDMKFSRVSGKKILGADAWCLNATYRDFTPWRLCFDQARKLMVTTGYDQDLYEFSDFQAVEGKQYPGQIRRLKQGKVVLEVRDLRAQLGPISQSIFEVPQAARAFETCDDMVSPKLIFKPELFPRASYQAGESIRIFIYGIVGQDGSFGNVHAASVPRDPAIVRLVEEAASKQRYSPAMCGAKPVAVESYIEVETARPIMK
jgi:hypothetical protein